MRIVDHLSKEQNEKLNKLKNKKQKLSNKDLRELMGMNRDTLKRGKGGALKRR